MHQKREGGSGIGGGTFMMIRQCRTMSLDQKFIMRIFCNLSKKIAKCHSIRVQSTKKIITLISCTRDNVNAGSTIRCNHICNAEGARGPSPHIFGYGLINYKLVCMAATRHNVSFGFDRFSVAISLTLVSASPSMHIGVINFSKLNVFNAHFNLSIRSNADFTRLVRIILKFT